MRVSLAARQTGILQKHLPPFSSPQALQLDSSENAKLGIMALTIGIPSAPVLRVVSENFPGVRISSGNDLVVNDSSKAAAT